MAKKDWIFILRDEWWDIYRMTRGDYQIDLVASGNWHEFCQLRFYKWDKECHCYGRITTDGYDWYQCPEDAPEFDTCFAAEKFALAWLNKKS